MTSRHLFIVYLALMLLLAATVSLRHFDLGVWNVVANMGIAAAKALLIALFFMRLWGETGLVRLFSLIGVVWLALLFLLTFADYLDRRHPPDLYPPASEPAATATRLHRGMLFATSPGPSSKRARTAR